MNNLMSTDDIQINLGAVISERGIHADDLIREFVDGLLADGVRVGGLVQSHLPKREDGVPGGIELIDVKTRKSYKISQDLGRESFSCMIDPAGLAEATKVLRTARADNVDLMVISRFSGLEAEGKGLTDDLMSAVSEGVPVLIVVAKRHLEAWTEATGGLGTFLEPSLPALNDWWAQINHESKK